MTILLVILGILFLVLCATDDRLNGLLLVFILVGAIVGLVATLSSTSDSEKYDALKAQRAAIRMVPFTNPTLQH